jgi:hypothetical protein
MPLQSYLMASGGLANMESGRMIFDQLVGPPMSFKGLPAQGTEP